MLKTRATAAAGAAVLVSYVFGAWAGRTGIPGVMLGLYAALLLAAAVLLARHWWRRAIGLPTRALLDHIEMMRRGTWAEPLPTSQAGEITELTSAINGLGEDLTLAAHRFATTSKLAAVAMIETRIGRRLNLAAQHLDSIGTLLAIARDYRQAVPESAIRNLELAMKDLKEIEVECKVEFEREFNNLRNNGDPKATALAAVGRVSSA